MKRNLPEAVVAQQRLVVLEPDELGVSHDELTQSEVLQRDHHGADQGIDEQVERAEDGGRDQDVRPDSAPVGLRRAARSRVGGSPAWSGAE
jgi:hypothetical protein